jgi:hypothetical protein
MAQIQINPLRLEEGALAEAAARQLVGNILNSYPHSTDVLAEGVQNAVDEITQAPPVADGMPAVIVRLNAEDGFIEVEDNGRGIPRDRIESLLAPNVTDKSVLFREGKVRGHKGVGLTFLAYGFNDFILESRTDGGDHYRVTIRDGRRWAIHRGDPEERPTLVQTLDDTVDDPQLSTRGTVIRVRPDDTSSPRRVSTSFPSAAFCSFVLESQTAIGQVLFGSDDDELADFEATLEYTSSAGSFDGPLPLRTTYRFPHVGVAGARILDRDLWKKLDRTEPAEDEKEAFQAVHRWYSPTQVVDALDEAAGGEVLGSRAEIADFIEAHRLHIYGLCSYAAMYRDTMADAWDVPRRRRLLLPGLRVAADHMISSWEPREVDLPRVGYVNRIWLVYHLAAVEPDLGRKNFPPDVHDVIRATEGRIATDLITTSQPFLEPVPRGGGEDAPPPVDDPLEISIRRREDPLSPSEVPGVGPISFATTPKEEQDVVALFSELIGSGLLGCYRLDYLTGIGIYDGFMQYEPELVSGRLAEKLPGRNVPNPLKGVVEFKYSGDSLIEDIVKKKKEWHKINWLVCWTLGTNARDYVSDRIAFTDANDEATRDYAGVTHLAAANSGGAYRVHVIALKDLLDRVK